MENSCEMMRVRSVGNCSVGLEFFVEGTEL